MVIARLRSWPWAPAALVLGVYAVAVWSVFHVMPAFAPDTRYYAAMTLRLTGLSQQEAYEHVRAFVDQFGYVTPSPSVLFGAGVVPPRMVYPVLSVPFVLVFGIPGMQVVPVAAMGLGLILTLQVGRRTVGLAATLAALLLLVASRRLIFYGGAMLTESLSFAITAGIALLLPWGGRRRSRRALLIAVGLIVVLGFTREATLIPVGAVAVAWLGSAVRERKLWTAWAPFAAWMFATAVLVQVLQGLLFPSADVFEHFLLISGTHSLRTAILHIPKLAWSITTTDLNNMVHSDIPLLILLLLAVVAGVVRWRHVDAHLLIGAVIATYVYNIINGVPSMFRYGIPGLAFVIVAVAYLVRSAVEQRLVPVSWRDLDRTEPSGEAAEEPAGVLLAHDQSEP